MAVTLVVGERNEKFHAVGERMAAAIPDARVELVFGAGHAAHLEAPDLVAAWIAGGEPGRGRSAGRTCKPGNRDGACLSGSLGIVNI
jgi:hypothetical protein